MARHPTHTQAPLLVWTTGILPNISTQIQAQTESPTGSIHERHRRPQHTHTASENGRVQTNPVIDFHPYYPSADPVNIAAHAYKASRPHPDPRAITMTTLAPKSLKQARRYPDRHQWAHSQNRELKKLDDAKVIKCLPDTAIPKKTKLIPLTMTYRYKRDTDSSITEPKARCSVRGDLMKPNVHYNPEHTASHMADKTTVRLLLAIKAAANLPSEHFDIKTAFIHENYKHKNLVYVRQHARFDGSYSHPGKGGQLIKNLYGTPSGGFYYLTATQNFL